MFNDVNAWLDSLVHRLISNHKPSTKKVRFCKGTKTLSEHNVATAVNYNERLHNRVAIWRREKLYETQPTTFAPASKNYIVSAIENRTPMGAMDKRGIIHACYIAQAYTVKLPDMALVQLVSNQGVVRANFNEVLVTHLFRYIIESPIDKHNKRLARIKAVH